MLTRLRRHMGGYLRAALDEANALMLSDQTGNIHSVGWGEKITKGQRTGKFGIVFSVKKKVPEVKLSNMPWIPVLLGQGWVVTDVTERPMATVELLRVPKPVPWQYGVTVHQQCHDCPIPGGVQIQPQGRNWLGTLGCKVVYRSAGDLRHGAITNWHVATGDLGETITQPTMQRDWFAGVAFSPGVKFDGSPNYVDLSVLDIQRIMGPYAPKTHTVKPEQVTLGAYSKELSTGGVGTQVARDGRTLGRVTNGEIVQVGASVQVGYGEGIALFVDQFIVKCQEGGCDFSAPGDSGSMVFEFPAMKPSGLLYAGGGGTTIVSPAEYILELGNVHSFQ